ncbi:MAG TPA: EVE domain-containing protein [Terriglobia bacterium]|jgi:predicted RNA-binding protein with PUA-like domain|nr:EVE domain-containing protein [Terriglobia bacterium]
MKWLLKSDPDTYSFADLERDGQTRWDGVSNNLALKNLRSAHRGDAVLVYHTGDEKAVVGLAEVTSDPYPDPKQNDPRLVVVDLKAGRRLSRPVPLAEIKQQASLKDFELVRLPRLSVMPVSDAQWKAILELGK